MSTEDDINRAAGKGWYNLNETSYETYCFSKLRRLLALTRYMMEDTLRSLIADNHAKFLAFVQGICSSKVSSEYQHLNAPLSASQLCARISTWQSSNAASHQSGV